MSKITKLVRENNIFQIEIPEEYVKKLGWKNGFVLKID